MEYATERNGNQITIWNETEEIGLQFTEGESMQRYMSCVRADPKVLTYYGLDQINQIVNELTQYATAEYPYEFQELQ